VQVLKMLLKMYASKRVALLKLVDRSYEIYLLTLKCRDCRLKCIKWFNFIWNDKITSHTDLFPSPIADLIDKCGRSCPVFERRGIPGVTLDLRINPRC